jgi:hypothetical protein
MHDAITVLGGYHGWSIEHEFKERRGQIRTLKVVYNRWSVVRKCSLILITTHQCNSIPIPHCSPHKLSDSSVYQFPCPENDIGTAGRMD